MARFDGASAWATDMIYEVTNLYQLQPIYRKEDGLWYRIPTPSQTSYEKVKQIGGFKDAYWMSEEQVFFEVL